MKEDRFESFMFGLLVVVAVIGFGGLFDLTGRVIRLLYTEWPYVAVGVVALFYAIIIGLVFYEFSALLKSFETENKEKLLVCDRRVEGVERDYKEIREEIYQLRESIRKYWTICERTLYKVDELAQQKSVTVIERKVEQVYSDQGVVAVVNDVLRESS
jgi:hypothetical protein